MRRPTSKSFSGCAAAIAVLALCVTASKAGQISSSGPALPEVSGTTAAAAAPAPAVVKKKRRVVRPSGETSSGMTVDLPANDDVYPDKPGAVVVDRNCLSCHSPEIVANQPQLTRTQWAAEIKKMREAYKAPIADDDAQTILDYLVSLRGEARTRYR